jgi:hypothetical protein
MSTFDEVEVLRDQLQAAQWHAELVKQLAALERQRAEEAEDQRQRIEEQRQRADERVDALQQHIDEVNFRYRLSCKNPYSGVSDRCNVM